MAMAQKYMMVGEIGLGVMTKEYIMTKKEFATLSNIELLKKLEWCGHDGYYNDIYYPILEELCRRLHVSYYDLLHDE